MRPLIVLLLLTVCSYVNAGPSKTTDQWSSHIIDDPKGFLGLVKVSTEFAKQTIDVNITYSRRDFCTPKLVLSMPNTQLNPVLNVGKARSILSDTILVVDNRHGYIAKEVFFSRIDKNLLLYQTDLNKSYLGRLEDGNNLKLFALAKEFTISLKGFKEANQKAVSRCMR
jgi:hypothetical protein